jgi:hypothetical protein
MKTYEITKVFSIYSSTLVLDEGKSRLQVCITPGHRTPITHGRGIYYLHETLKYVENRKNSVSAGNRTPIPHVVLLNLDWATPSPMRRMTSVGMHFKEQGLRVRSEFMWQRMKSSGGF